MKRKASPHLLSSGFTFGSCHNDLHSILIEDSKLEGFDPLRKLKIEIKNNFVSGVFFEILSDFITSLEGI